MHSSTYSSPRDVFGAADVVAYYLGADYLEEPEARVINLLQPQLAQMRMLDIAIGTGRTTKYFAPLVKEYIGLDFCEEMIEQCVASHGSYANAQFFVADMRDLSKLQAQSFDFVLISYNAISAMSHEDRQKVFQEVHRVSKPGAYFFFSAHNLQSVDKLFSVQKLVSVISPLHPKQSYWGLREWVLRRCVYNPPTAYPKIKRNDYAIINDGAHQGRLLHYYVKPLEQIAQLNTLFEKTRVFKRNGEEILTADELPAAADDWLFYLCNNR